MSRHSIRTWVFLLCALLCGLKGWSQSPLAETPLSLTNAHVFQTEDFSIEIDTVATNIGPLADADLTDYNCYRLFVTTSNATDQVSAVFGNVDAPAALVTSGDFFQSYPIGDITPSGMVPAVWPSFPSNQFDSFITIGIDAQPNAANGEGDVLTVQSSQNPWQPLFEPGNGAPGSGFELADITGGTWFTQSAYTNGIAGDDHRVLIAQLTTNGVLSGNLNVQVFLEGDNQFGSVYLNLTIPVLGCTDESACNYDAAANEDDGSCATLDECGVCDGQGIPAGDCDCDGNQLDALGVCGGSCTADADADGICDDVDECVGALDECGVCNGPGAVLECGCSDIPAGDCDCIGNQPDALGVCDGSCTADLDGDGVCDDVDECVGALDECGVCNGPGAVLECGCSDIPAGDCDCIGNQPDALGACGGSCTADLDGDGVCDDVDECVGTLDECGICNGPGAIYDCGCAGIPAGDCDCDGNQLDALGVCGGPCTADLDGDGVCDDIDPCVGALDACGICNGPGAIYDCGCAGIPAGDCDCDGNQLDALGVCGGDCTGDADSDGVCDDDEVEGCRNPAACNFDADPTTDNNAALCLFPTGCDTCSGQNDGTGTVIHNDADGDGVCNADEITGCTLPGACNYDADPTTDTDNSLCVLPTGCDTCSGQTDGTGVIIDNDADGDGVCNADEVEGCTDPAACNYDNTPTTDSNNALCTYLDGICQSCEGGVVVDNDTDADGVCDADEVPGCQDSSACNFNAAATDEDGSCTYLDGICQSCEGGVVVDNDTDADGVCDADEVPGCQDSSACNYNAAATDEDGSCTYLNGPCDVCESGVVLDFDADNDGVCDANEIAGCTDPLACNYDADPTTDTNNGICTYASGCDTCSGQSDGTGSVVDNDADDDGVCDADEVTGCTDPLACNYDANPTTDTNNGLCLYATGCDVCSGESDGTGTVLDQDADNDGVCDADEVTGCTDPLACNYDANPTTNTDNSLCDFPQAPCGFCQSGASQGGDADGDGVCDANEIEGCQDASACNFNPEATDDDGSCLAEDAIGTCGGNCTADLDADGICDDVDPCVGELDALGICGGDCTEDIDEDGVCDTDEIPGCTDPAAINHLPEATDDDGSCTYSGCTDVNADNYNPAASIEDGTCAYTCTGLTGCTYPSATNYDPDADCDNGACEFVLTVDDGCMFDIDGSGYIGSADLLIFLQYFEFNCN